MSGPIIQSQRSYSRPVLFGTDQRTVERPGPGLAPTAYRIWQAGENITDDGPTIFSPRSASLLMQEQADRGNLSSIDFDHLSLKEDRPAEAGRAAGWCTLGVRLDEAGEPELWAENVDWCADVKEGLEEQPPKWRYFSPACDLNVETREVISYLNTALCINPKTWHNNALAAIASRSEVIMTKAEREKLAVLNAMHASMSTEGEHQAAAESMYAMHGGAEEHEKLKKMAEGGDEGEGPESAPGSAPAAATATAAAAGDDEPESAAAAAGPPTSRSPGAPAKAASTATVAVAAARAPNGEADPQLMATVHKLASRLTTLEADNAAMKEERRATRVAQILASRKDLSTEFRSTLVGLRASQVRKIVDALPKPAATTKATAVVATRGAEQGKAGLSTPPGVQAEVDKAMRIPLPAGPAQGFGEVINGERQFHTRRPSEHREAQTRLASKAVH